MPTGSSRRCSRNGSGLDAERGSAKQIIEEEQAHRAQVAALLQMQLQALQRVDEQEKELQRLSALLVEHQEIVQSLPERPHKEIPQASPRKIYQIRHEAVDYLPSTMKVDRGTASRTSQVPSLSGPPTIKRDTCEDILTDAEVPVTPQRWVQFADMATSMPLVCVDFSFCFIRYDVDDLLQTDVVDKLSFSHS